MNFIELSTNIGKMPIDELLWLVKISVRQGTDFKYYHDYHHQYTLMILNTITNYQEKLRDQCC